MGAEGTPEGPVEVPPGLDGVVVATTLVGDVRGVEGRWAYRGYDAADLARTRPFEHTWQLLVDGVLPSREAAAAFAAEVRPRRVVAPGPSPARGLRAALALEAEGWGLPPLVRADAPRRRADGLRVVAVLPTLLARAVTGAPATPDPTLDPATDLLRMCRRGELPAHDEAAALDRYLTVAADHGFATSTFAARVVASTGGDLVGAVLAGMAALAGPRHGGAPEAVLRLLDAAVHDGAARAVEQAAARGPLPGFGNRVYRTTDPRVALLEDAAVRLGGERVEVARAVAAEGDALLAERQPGRGLRANQELWAAVLLERLGFAPERFAEVFACARAVAWVAHVEEQLAVGRVVRPVARYGGPAQLLPVPEAP